MERLGWLHRDALPPPMGDHEKGPRPDFVDTGIYIWTRARPGMVGTLGATSGGCPDYRAWFRGVPAVT